MLEQLFGVPFTLLSFVVALSVVVFVHEFGHFYIARRNGVRCESFSIGFGPELFGRTDKHGTRWKFSLIPLGGYVKMFGEAETMQIIEGGDDGSSHDVVVDGKAPAAAMSMATTMASPTVKKKNKKVEHVLRELTPEEQAVSFKHKTVGQRAAIVFAGPAVNFIFAILVFWIAIMWAGMPVTEPVIGKVVDGSPAAAAGLQPEDRIVSIDGAPVSRFEDIQSIISLAVGEPMNIVLRRDEREMTLTVAPRLSDEKDIFGNAQKRYILGIGASGETRRVEMNPAQAFGASVGQTYDVVKGTLVAMGQIINGSRGTEDLGGPIKIAKYSGQAAKSGIPGFILFMAILSLNLGFINLFPVPLLDGGHLLFYAIEAARGRPLSEQAQEWGMRVGLALVMALMVFVTWNDIIHL